MSITLYTVPKAFEGGVNSEHIALIQDNAIRSWMALPGVHIVLMGDDPGVRAFAQKHNLEHHPRIEGTHADQLPLMSQIFNHIFGHKREGVKCFINADILLFPDFLEAVKLGQMTYPNFMLIGSRWDFDITERINFQNVQEVSSLKERITGLKDYALVRGSDYYVFSQTFPMEMPDFMIGRGYWDFWLINAMVKSCVPTIDCTQAIIAGHQNHDYAHAQGLNTHSSDIAIYQTADGMNNYHLSGGVKNFSFVSDCPFVMGEGAVKNVRTDMCRALDGFLHRVKIYVREEHKSVWSLLRKIKEIKRS